ncbi:MAG: YbgC/FadM family acyl-CoA thioesterase [Acidovorax sp.]|jgi:acyl-CoA thioester hydrolase|nr:YbgC/FadM family acyl-CoA thioesterase [Acidovorax sp.]
MPMHTSDFRFPLRIYWEDTDGRGLVHPSKMLHFYERARTEWLRALGIEQQKLREQTGGIFVVSHAAVDYQAPARLDDLLWVTARLQSAGRASITIAQQALLQDSMSSDGQPQLLSEGAIRIGWVDATSMRPARIPASILEQLS